MIRVIESFIAGLAIVIASAVYIPRVLAEEVSPELERNNTQTIPEAIDQAATDSSVLSEGDFFKDRSLGGDAAFIFGIGYDENKLAEDARKIGAISQDLLDQQASEGPIIRTQDLPNPYSASLLTDTELIDAETEPSETEQPTRVRPTETEQPTEAEPETTETQPSETEQPTEAEPETTETQPSEAKPSETDTEPSETDTEPSETETEPSEAKPSETDTETEKPSKAKPSETDTEPSETEP